MPAEERTGVYFTVTGTVISPEPKPLRKRLPPPGLPPVTLTVAVALPAGTTTSGMITLSGASVVTSRSSPPVGGGVGQGEGQRLRLAARERELGRGDGERSRIDAEGADGRGAVGAGDLDLVVAAGLDGGDEEADGARGLEHGAGRGAVEGDGVLRGEAASKDAHVGADGTAVDFQREHVASDDLRVDDVGVFFLGAAAALSLQPVVDEKVVGDLGASGGELVIKRGDVRAKVALGHVETLAVDDDANGEAAGDDVGRPGIHVGRDRVDLRGVFRDDGGREIGDGHSAAGEEEEAERSAGRQEDSSRVGEAVVLHWVFQI